jgi:hypothetical protein
MQLLTDNGWKEVLYEAKKPRHTEVGHNCKDASSKGNTGVILHHPENKAYMYPNDEYQIGPINHCPYCGTHVKEMLKEK